MDTSLFAQITQAGATMLPLVACSVVALGLSVHKVVEFWRHRLGDRAILATAAPLLRSDALAQLAAHCRQVDTPLARVMAITAQAAVDTPRRAEAAGLRACDEEVRRYSGWLPALGWIAQVAPLFGLLGTVVGMVELFSVLEAAAATADTGMVTGGIWKALLTTAAGLVIAIPTLGVHLWLSRRLEDLDGAMAGAVGRIVDLLEDAG